MFDAFWNSWIAPLPDVLSADWFGAARDVISLLVGGVGTYLAWLAIKMGREQDAVTAKQVGILEKLAELEGRQAAIASTQHETAVALARRVPGLEMAVERVRVSFVDGPSPYYSYQLRIVNTGSRTARDVKWQLVLPQRSSVDASPGCAILHRSEGVDLDASRLVASVVGHMNVPVHPRERLLLASVKVEFDKEVPPPHGIATCEYVLICEDGAFPNEGKGLLNIETGAVFAREARHADLVDNAGQKP